MITIPVAKEVLQKAIELRISDCFQAMNIANQIGGSSSPEWDLVREHSLIDLVAEALDQRMDVGNMKSAVGGVKFTDCRLYEKVREQIGGRMDFPGRID